MSVKKRVLSLFSGCGGMDLGFEGGFEIHVASVNSNIYPEWLKEKGNNDRIILPKTAFNLVFANDILEPAKIAWTTYFKKHKYGDDSFHIESIVDLVKAHMKGEFKFPENIDIVTGGFPCQDFSVAGKKKRL